ncbi:MAG TPA: glycosyltransferase [Candidatus Limnocylindrales bacterium]|nr:glycosyltransferase [Candidatus Limnocylindrales bacterium]
MRILLLSHAPVVHTQRWAAALKGRGHEVRLLTVEAAPWAADPGRVIGPRFPLRAFRYPAARGDVMRETRDFRPEATVAHFLPNYGFLAALAGASPLLLVCWGSDLLINATRSPFHRARARYTLRHSDLVHVDARLLARAAARLGAPEDRIWTRPWGVDTDALAPRTPWEARRAGAPEPRLLWTRRLAPLYDPETFVRALGLLRRRGVSFQATIAGEGPLRPALEALARDLEIGASVRFAGWVGEEDLRALYRSHEIYVSLSRSDSTSQSLLEAMAAGLVPVVSDIEGNREWVTHRSEGLLVPPGDAEAVARAIAEVVGAGVAAGGGASGGAGGRTGVGTRAPAAMAERSRARVAREASFADTVAETEARLAALAALAGARGHARGRSRPPEGAPR